MLEPLEIKLDLLEGLARGHEGHSSAALVGRADDPQGLLRIAVTEAHEMLLAIAPDGEVEPFAKGVNDRDADAVEPARHFVGIILRRILELTSGVELGHDDLGRGHPFLRMDPGWNSAPVVLDAHGAVG